MSNRAAYITAAKARPFAVQDAPLPEPGSNEVVVRSYAAAINPVDWKIQDYGVFIENYPAILGTDAAGTVHAVGSSVTHVKPGDRVIAHLDGLANKQNTNNGFQLFPKTASIYVAKLPDNISFAEGSVLPLAISTAAAGLFQKDYLSLPHPQVGGKATQSDEIVLVWGGSSSVGSTVIQLARAAGLQVATTASAHNHDYVKALGASHVFDHTSSSVVDDIVSALKGKKFVGIYDAISTEDTVKKNVDIASKLDGKKFVATVLPPPEGLNSDVTVKGVFALTIAGNEVGKAVWSDFVPEALKDGSLKTKPEPLVIGKGLEKLQEGCDKNKAGVSAKKVVIEFD